MCSIRSAPWVCGTWWRTMGVGRFQVWDMPMTWTICNLFRHALPLLTCTSLSIRCLFFATTFRRGPWPENATKPAKWLSPVGCPGLPGTKRPTYNQTDSVELVVRPGEAAGTTWLRGIPTIQDLSISTNDRFRSLSPDWNAGGRPMCWQLGTCSSAGIRLTWNSRVASTIPKDGKQQHQRSVGGINPSGRLSRQNKGLDITKLYKKYWGHICLFCGHASNYPGDPVLPALYLSAARWSLSPKQRPPPTRPCTALGDPWTHGTAMCSMPCSHGENMTRTCTSVCLTLLCVPCPAAMERTWLEDVHLYVSHC